MKKTDPVNILASGLGLGYSPYAPGTVGTFLGIPAAMALNILPPELGAAAMAAFIFVSVAVCGKAAENAQAKDPGWIVLDEVVGFCIASLFLQPSVPSFAAAFLLFRLFDILKPPPVGWFDRNIPGGWGIVLDDVAAGALARLSLFAVGLFLGF